MREMSETGDDSIFSGALPQETSAQECSDKQPLEAEAALFVIESVCSCVLFYHNKKHGMCKMVKYGRKGKMFARDERSIGLAA